MANRHYVAAQARRIFSFAVLCLGFVLMQPTEGADRLATGTVIDERTKAPLSGAYVMAVYRHPDSLISPDPGRGCVKALGMYTGADGRFSFPLESMDGYSPDIFYAIARGYYASFVRGSDGHAWFKRTARDYVDLQVGMRKQDPLHPEFGYSSGEEFCKGALSPKDGAAGTEFMRIKLGEMMRYGASAGAIADLKGTIEQREAREGASK